MTVGLFFFCRVQHRPITISVIEPPSCNELYADGISLNDLILPRVIIWDPLTQLPVLNRCPAEGCEKNLALSVWTIGESKATQPRVLHDTHSMVLLVSAVYKCGNNEHTVFATDPRLIKNIKSFQLPFTLLHRTGFTRTFIHCVISLAKEGMPMQAIVRHIQSLREQFAAELLLRLTTHFSMSSGQVITQSDTLLLAKSNLVTLISRPIPSNDLITRCVIINFLENEHFYKLEMLKVEVKHCLRLDHTFKVALNIGFLRSDGKWITQYGSVFLVLNDEGQVLTWQLTNSTSFDEVMPLLTALKKRIQNRPLIIYVDNCCQVKKKLQAIFGEDVIVKLDLFHAVQRVTRVMSKKHALFHTCMQDLRMIFREPTDIWEKRTMKTPSSVQIESNLNNFLTKWKLAEVNGQYVLNEKVIVQLQSLRMHAKRGCLSDIVVSGGTGRNEALHRHVNPHFSHSGRMGITLAYALLSILLYTYNAKKEKNPENSLTGLIAAKLEAAQKCSTSAEFGIVGKQKALVSEDCVSEQGELMTAESIPTISVHCIESLVRCALSSADLATSLCHIVKDSPQFSYHMIPFMSAVPSLYFKSSRAPTCDHAQEHARRLTNILDSCSMQQHPIEGDGNCCFSAVAFGLLQNIEKMDEPNKHFLANLGINQSMNLSTLAGHLRKIAVKEWLDNSWYYEGFLLDNVNIDQEAPKFLDQGYFHGDLADTMITAISNALETPIIVFSSLACHPIHCIKPRTQMVSVPVMVAFNQFGPGHYDGVVPKDMILGVNSTRCSCGRNDRSGGTHCHEIKCKYTTISRCPCMKGGNACTEMCKCRGCGNPLGRLTRDTPKRKRNEHAWQTYKLTSSANFANSKSENLTNGPFSKAEFFLLENIYCYCIDEEIEITPKNIHKIYLKIVASETANLDSISVSNSRSVSEIEKFIKMRKKNLRNFEQLCKMQLSWNSNKEM